MPTKTEFKFNCPTCGQHILVATEWCGRQINCPSCQTNLTIPQPPKEKQKPAPVMPPSPATQPNYSSQPIRVELPKQESTSAAAPKSGAPNTPLRQPAAGSLAAKATPTATDPPQPQQLRIAVLTPAVKLDMVRSVRRRIANEPAWLPGKVGGKPAYAAKMGNGEPVLVEVKEPQAARFSLLGAFLLELRQRQVVRTATGRTRLLDQEIPDAVRDALTEGMSDEAREQSEASLLSDEWMSATHAQCLAALDVLEETYSQRMNQQRAEKAKRRLGTTRLPYLMKKLEKKARIESEDVATALYHEVMELRRRLDRLENRAVKEK